MTGKRILGCILALALGGFIVTAAAAEPAPGTSLTTVQSKPEQESAQPATPTLPAEGALPEQTPIGTALQIPAELQDDEARWQFIERTITSLATERLKTNPGSARIMELIASIYGDNIGRDTDSHNFYYKHRLALIMHRIFLSREEQDIPAIVKAPKEFKDLLADPDVAAALSRFQLNPPEKDVLAINEARDLFDFPAAIVKVLKDDKYTVAKKKICAYTTARILRDRYGMQDLEIMGAMERDFGKFDWRLPEPHAIYWATMAKITEPERYKTREINYDRLLIGSLQAASRGGLIGYLGYDPHAPLVTTFDLSKLKPIDKLFQDQLAQYPITDPEHPEYRGADSIRDGHIQFLQESEFNLYFSGFVEEARRYHTELYRLYNKPDPFEDLEHVCIGKVKKLVYEGGLNQVRAFVDDLIVMACFDLCMNMAIEAHQKENVARCAWQASLDFVEAQQEGKNKPATNAAFPTWKDVLNGDVSQLLQGHFASFPPQLIPVLRNILKVPVGAEVNKLDVGATITPEILPSSPPPK